MRGMAGEENVYKLLETLSSNAADSLYAVVISNEAKQVISRGPARL